MKVLLSSLFLLAFTVMGNATVHEVEVGGNQQITPYYSPQNLTIVVGDEIHWTFVSGTHNVTSTSGPESFASGDIASPNDFSITFNTAGVYDYECTLWDHADTQFGTITVEASTVAIAQVEELVEINVFPIPAANLLDFSTESNVSIDQVSLFAINGKMIINENNVSSINVSELSSGVYFLVINTNQGIVRKKISIEK